MSATDAAFTPSRNAPATRDARMRGTRRPLIATRAKDGRKIPTVAATALPAPLDAEATTYPYPFPVAFFAFEFYIEHFFKLFQR